MHMPALMVEALHQEALHQVGVIHHQVEVLHPVAEALHQVGVIHHQAEVPHPVAEVLHLAEADLLYEMMAGPHRIVRQALMIP